MGSEIKTPLNSRFRISQKTKLVIQMLILAILGYMYLWYTWTSSNYETSKRAMNKATTVATMINGEEFKRLNAVKEDVGTIAYESIKNRLMELVKSNGDIRFAYLYTMKDNKLYFMVDSESIESKDYISPGQEYTEADKSYSMPFIDGKELITAPLTDRWGIWISFLVPIKDGKTGKTVAVLGMDYPAKAWQDNARYQTIQAGILVVAFASLIFALFGILKKKEAVETAKEALHESERSKSVLLSNLPGMSYRCFYDSEWTMEFVSEGCYELSGYKPKELLYNSSLSYNDIIIPEDREHVRKSIENAVNLNEAARIEYRILTANHQERWVWEQGIPIYSAEGQIEALEGLIIDITDRKKLEVDLANEKKLLETTLISVGDGVISTDNVGNIVFLNKVAEFLTGWKQEAARGNPIKEVFCIVNELTREKSEDIVEKVLESRQILEIANHTILISADGTERPIEDSAAPIVNENGEIIGVVLVFRDFSEKKQKQEEILYLSYHDKLTGLKNRRFYEEEIKRLDTEKNLPISIIIGDVNGLKLVNDAFGHDKGDELLQKAAASIQGACRTDDIVARWGGDEFVILMPKTKPEEAEKIVNRIKVLYSNEQVNDLSISISFGWDTKSKADQDILKVLKSAEDYMYEHKIIENKGMRSNTINTITNTLHEKNPREEKHSQRVSEICLHIGKAIGFSEIEISKLKVVGLLHDIGKIAIEEGILNKPGKLTEQERNEMKRHPDIGYRILSSSYDMLELADCIMAHHERWDGTGYPKGLSGDAIPKVARIIALADSYDAMTSERPYRKALCEEEVLAEIRNNAGTQFDPEIARIFMEKVLEKQWE